MAASPVAARAAVGEELRRQHEQPGLRIQVAGVATVKRLGMSGKDLGRVRRLGRQPTCRRLCQRPRRDWHLLHSARLRRVAPRTPLLRRRLFHPPGAHEATEHNPAGRALRFRHALDDLRGELDGLFADRHLRSTNQADPELLALAAEGALVHGRTVPARRGSALAWRFTDALRA